MFYPYTILRGQVARFVKNCIPARLDPTCSFSRTLIEYLVDSDCKVDYLLSGGGGGGAAMGVFPWDGATTLLEDVFVLGLRPCRSRPPQLIFDEDCRTEEGVAFIRIFKDESQRTILGENMYHGRDRDANCEHATTRCGPMAALTISDCRAIRVDEMLMRVCRSGFEGRCIQTSSPEVQAA